MRIRLRGGGSNPWKITVAEVFNASESQDVHAVNTRDILPKAVKGDDTKKGNS